MSKKAKLYSGILMLSTCLGVGFYLVNSENPGHPITNMAIVVLKIITAPIP